MPIVLCIALLSGLIFLLPDCSHALQSHGPPEGLYVHQMAHLHFIVAMAYLFWDVKRSAFTGQAWKYLRVFCVLMILWNIIAFCGHWMETLIRPEEIIRNGGYLQSRLVGPVTWVKTAYFLAKLDHLVVVPGLVFLYLAMRTMRRNVERSQSQEDEA